jgi:hypothetical protein
LETQMREPHKMIPTSEFLKTVEDAFAVTYPEEFKRFCRVCSRAKPSAQAVLASEVVFICDLDTLHAVNVRVGEEQWGDYEQAIAGRRHPKNGNRLWGGILPFATQDDCVFGFNLKRPQSDQVLVWSIHTIVFAYPSLALFLEAVLPKNVGKVLFSD